MKCVASQLLHVWLQVWNCTYACGVNIQSCQKPADPTLLQPRVVCTALKNSPWSETLPFLKWCSRPHLTLRQRLPKRKVTEQTVCTRGVWLSINQIIAARILLAVTIQTIVLFPVFLPLSPQCKPQLWVHNLGWESGVHGSINHPGRCFQFSSSHFFFSLVVFLPTLYKYDLLKLQNTCFKNRFENKFPSSDSRTEKSKRRG